MHCCMIRICVKQYKNSEYLESIHSLLPKFRQQKGCISFRLYHDSESENAFVLVGEWKTRQAMERYFHSTEFGVLIGASRVLCDDFVMNIYEISKSGGVELAREQILSGLEKKSEGG